MKDNKVGAHEL
jgi:hypothetical protein